MSPRRLAHSAATALQVTAIVAALAWGASVTLVVVSLGRLIGADSNLLLAVTLGLLAATLVLRHAGPVWTAERVALWVEQGQQGLKYAFITAVQLEQEGKAPAVELLNAAEKADVTTLVRQARLRALRPALAALLLGLTSLLLVSRYMHAEATRADRPVAGGTVQGNRLRSLVAHLQPPAYAALPASTVKEPQQLTALVGTRIELRGADDWAQDLTMPAEPEVLTLRDREFRRLVTLLPRPDSIPEVVLRQPAHDTTYRTAPSTPISLEADARDDLGLASGYWEFLITTGSGEQFETVTRLGGRVAFGKQRSGTLRTSLRLDTLHLTPGSVINLRAIVLDANNVSGPGKGVSDTRTIRIAAIIDSTGVAAEPAIPIDSMWMSQRLLNMRTDTLILDRRRITRTEFGSRAVNLSNGQETIRARVIAVVALLEDDGVGGSEPTEESKLLRQAGVAMLSARFLLATAEADSARPFMRRALAILDEIRNARRYHIRGVIRPNPVDIASVRLTGTEPSEPVAAGQRPPLELAERRLAERLARVVSLAEADPIAAADSLVFLQVQLLKGRADVAALIGSALTAVKQGTAMGTALVPARRRLSAMPVRLSGTGEWSGGTAP